MSSVAVSFRNRVGDEIGHVGGVPKNAKRFEVFRDGRFGWKVSFGALYKLSVSSTSCAASSSRSSGNNQLFAENVYRIDGIERLESLETLNLSKDLCALAPIDEWLDTTKLRSLNELHVGVGALPDSCRAIAQGLQLAKALKLHQSNNDILLKARVTVASQHQQQQQQHQPSSSSSIDVQSLVVFESSVLEFPSSEQLLGENVDGTSGYGGVRTRVVRSSMHGTPVAVKFIDGAAADSALFDEQLFYTEVALARFRLHHRNIVQRFGVLRGPSSSSSSLSGPAIVDELLECGSLYDALRVRRREFSVAERLSIARDVAAALAFTHSWQLVHGNLCSNNVLLSAAPLTAKVRGMMNRTRLC